ncbi:max dimerization protein 1-like isoform X2 [Ostrinia furnacalis]|uniref:max dimerization protein 1-like isoform X2 n=1 Tax=Ostrinia furnacalis TaxID=93504 RepID=UPI00103A785A|nr:max dimerization protein 1-like isoform X2 [Ostrinia furnacalis]
MSIADLIQAAEFLERRDREAEHGYASSLPGCEESRSGGRRPKTKKSQGSRTTHNELEKNRYVLHTNYLSVIKTKVPVESLHWYGTHLHRGFYEHWCT